MTPRLGTGKWLTFFYSVWMLILDLCRFIIEPPWSSALEPHPVALDAHPWPVEVILRSWGSSCMGCGRAGSPWCLSCSPGAMEAHPGALKTHPGALEAHSGAVEAHPGALNAHLLTIKSLHAQPVFMEDHPGAMETHPGHVEVYLGAI